VNDAEVRGHAEIAAPAAAADRVAAHGAMSRDPHLAPEMPTAPHVGVDGGHACKLMPVREGPGEQRHPLPNRTAIGRTPDVDPVAGLDPVRTNVDCGTGGEGSSRQGEHENRGQSEGSRTRIQGIHGRVCCLVRPRLIAGNSKRSGFVSQTSRCSEIR